MTTYTSDLASERHLSATRRAAILPVQVGPTAQYDGEGALAVRLGIVASFR